MNHPNIKRGLPWHWLLLTTALLAAVWGGWTLWGPMPIAKQLPPPSRERFQLKEVVDAPDLKALKHRQVIMVGRFTGHTVILEGDMAGRSGFYVLSPLAERRRSYVDGAETGLTVLLLRGWVPTRERARNIVPLKSDLIIEGRLAFPNLGAEAKAAGETGLFRKNLSLEGYAREIGVPLLPMVLLQEPGSEWSDKDIRQDAFQRRWPELYPQDKYMVRKGWAMLALAGALAALSFWARPVRRKGRDSEFAETIPYPEGDADRPAGAMFLVRRHAKVLAALGLVAAVAASVVLHYRNEFSRLDQVGIGSTPYQPGSLEKLVFKNNSSSKIEFLLRCHHKARDGEVLFSKAVVLPPNASVEFGVHPEHADQLPRIVRDKSCEAIWRGPLGIERSAWWANWRYRKSAHKSTFAD